MIESFYFVVLEYVIEEEIFIVEFKGIDMMGEGFVIFDFVFFVIDIYKVRYNLLRVDYSFVIRFIMFFFKMIISVCFL